MGLQTFFLLLKPYSIHDYNDNKIKEYDRGSDIPIKI